MSQAHVASPSAGKPLLLNRRLFAIEFAIIIVMALIATRQYSGRPTYEVQNGREAEWMTSSAFHASDVLHEQGRIPGWQPMLNRGEPFVHGLFSYVLNPISIGPSLIFGSDMGVRYSVILYAILSGIGGWAIAWLIGLGSPSRILLGVMLIGFGNMPALIGVGYYQTGTSQALLPWVIAGSIAIARFRHSRAPVALVAVALTLIYFNGYIYFILPALIFVGTIALFLCIHINPAQRLIRFDWKLLSRYILALVFTLGMSIAIFFPTFLQQGFSLSHVGGEPPESVYESPITVLNQFLTTSRSLVQTEWNENYDLFVVPLWFVAILFVFLPPAMRRFSRLADSPFLQPVVLLAMFLIVFFLLWGSGVNPIMRWLYANFPFFSRWRFLFRLLTVVSLWLSVIVAIRFDSLWRAVMLNRRGKHIGGLSRLIIGSVLIFAAFAAISDGISKYNRNAVLAAEDYSTTSCLRQLRERHPEGYLSAIANDYTTITPFLREQVRFTFFTSEHHPLGMTPTLFPYDLRQNFAQFYIFGNDGDRAYWAERGYQIVPDILIPDSDRPCFMEYSNPLPYAFAISREELVNYTPPENAAESVQTRYLLAEDVIDLPHYRNLVDTIALTVVAPPDEEMVVTVQELSWPGWVVTIDGQPATVESIGYMIGVVLPADGASHDILFRYDAPLFRQGAVVTLVTIAIVSLWLLRVDRLILRRSPAPQLVETWDADEVEETAEAESAEPATAQRLQLPVWLVEAFRPREVEAPAEEGVLPFIDQEPEPTPTSTDTESAEIIPFDD